jgi:hypothetical protein
MPLFDPNRAEIEPEVSPIDIRRVVGMPSAIAKARVGGAMPRSLAAILTPKQKRPGAVNREAAASPRRTA